MNTKSSAADPLEGFDLRKYEACTEWDARKWLIALSQRAQLRYFLSFLRKGNSKDSLPEEILKGEREFFLGIARDRLSDPVALSDSAPRAAAPCVLRDALLTDILYACEIAESAEMEDFRGIRLRDVEKAMGSTAGTVYLAIDLRAPDSLLQEEFGRWLKKVRTESGLGPAYPFLSFGKADFAEWHSQKLLPYLDLVFWAKMSGYNLTQAAIGLRLYPAGLEDSRNRLRTVSRNALRLISRQYINVLARQSRPA